MILNQTTISILKNFAGINQGIYIKNGNLMRTVSIRKNIFATSPVEDDFPRDFAIYDLNEFIATMNLLTDPDLEFKNEFILITDSESRSKIKYYYSSPSVVVSPPDKDIMMPDPDISFVLSDVNFNRLIKAATVMKLKTLSITPEGLSVKNDTGVGNVYDLPCDVVIADGFGGQDLNISIDNLKIIEGTYEVNVSSKGLARFKCTSPSYPGLEYFIALEADK